MATVHERYKNYEGDSCWQYNIRQRNLDQDLKEASMSIDQMKELRTRDFTFQYIDKSDIDQCREIVRFIERHEWLGKMPNRPTHRFTARYKNMLAGVIIMAVPNTHSKILGIETERYERLISRGACISWSPKNLNSWLIMKSIDWMIHNTTYRLFFGYGDPEAKELGSIYQACSFMYVGQSSGTEKQYLDPTNEKAGWFSERHFRHKSMYAKYAKNIGLDKQQWKSYMKKWSPDWTKVPEDISKKIKEELEKYKLTCNVRETKSKHKYIFCKGIDKNETKKLKRLLEQNKIRALPYPKERGK